MHYIILDLEWNQPIHYQSAVYRRVGDRLMFEVIQIGAAKVEDNNGTLTVVDELDLMIRPTQYHIIHPRVKRMTGITEAKLADAPDFIEAMDIFHKWCGDDCLFVTWGREDISVLAQNITFFQHPKPIERMYDLQQCYAHFLQKKGQDSLKTAMETLAIEVDEYRTFHNATDDAFYTAEIFCAVKANETIQKYPIQARTLLHNGRKARFRATDIIQSVEQAFASPALQTPQCPTCKQPCPRTTDWLYQSQGKYVSLCKCQHHGEMLVKVRFALLGNGDKGMNLSIVPADRQMKSYVHTKVLQTQYRRAHAMPEPSLDSALSNPTPSDMPFDHL